MASISPLHNGSQPDPRLEIVLHSRLVMDRRRELVDRIVAWSPVLLLGALAALTYWLDAQVQPPAARRDGSSRHDPDLFLEDFKSITFDADGRPRETLLAARADHFPDDDSAELTKPTLELAESGQPKLKITADRGRINGDRNQGDFIGHVTAEREAPPADANQAAAAGANDGARAANDRSPTKVNAPTVEGALKLLTESLHVTTRDQRVQTDRAVTIEDARGIIRAKGLEYDNKSKTVRLKSNVSGTFQPQDISR
jgi:lipopolysaccharide export system protein LptC